MQRLFFSGKTLKITFMTLFLAQLGWSRIADITLQNHFERSNVQSSNVEPADLQRSDVHRFNLQAQVWQDLLTHDEEWYGGRASRQMAERILLYQRASGGWPKNIDYKQNISAAEKEQLREYPDEPAAGIDNGATFTELYFLARLHRAVPEQRYALAFLRGLDYLLAAQYDNGGWPQFYPLRPGFYAHITFNDDAMIGVIRLLRDVDRQKAEFAFVDGERRRKAAVAVAKGVECILKTQIRTAAGLTAWCQQYDEKTLQPAGARTYEHPSLSGEESVGIVQFLMELEPPSAAIITAVQSAVAWLDAVKITGIRVVQKADSTSPFGYDSVVIEDAQAPPIWARFYTITTHRPFFSDRDGLIYYNLADISIERRNEYGWLGYWPQQLLRHLYPPWQQKWAPAEDVRQK